MLLHGARGSVLLTMRNAGSFDLDESMLASKDGQVIMHGFPNYRHTCIYEQCKTLLNYVKDHAHGF